MAASVALHPAATPRNRSIEARRAARRARYERERLIVDCLNRGVSIAEIAQRIGVTEKRARAVAKDILARRMPAAPEDFAALQVSRLNEALLVAYDAMSDQNLRAVALVVRIVRELDRYHGFVAADRRPGRADAEVEEAPCGMDTSPFERRAPLLHEVGASGAEAPADRPQTAPQAPETREFAPEKDVDPKAWEAASIGSLEGCGEQQTVDRTWSVLRQAQDVLRQAQDEEKRSPPIADCSNQALPPAGAPAPSASACAGAEMAPQAIENVKSAPGNDPAAGPTDAPSSHGEPPWQPPPASPIELPPETRENLYPVAPVLVPDPSAPGGFRRVNIRMLPNGMAFC